MARVWITDGSIPVYSDTRRLRARHKGFLGLPVRYEGFVDPDVPRGEMTVDAARPDDVLFVEAEWCVEFPDGIDRYLDAPDSLEESSPIVLQGLIEGKWLNRLLGTRAWRPASLGNSVLAAGPGIATTVRALERGEVDGTARVEYDLDGGGRQAYVTTLADLRGQNVLELMCDVLRDCREQGEALDVIDLGAMGDGASAVNEPRRLKAALRGDRVPLLNPLNMPPHRTKERLVRRALSDNIGVPPVTPAHLTTSDGTGAVVGEAALSWHHPS